MRTNFHSVPMHPKLSCSTLSQSNDDAVAAHTGIGSCSAATSLHSQSGSFMLEALVAILIFSIGVLGTVGLQAAALKHVGEAKYRADANFFVNQLVSQMRIGDRTPTTLQTLFQGASGSGGVGYVNWLSSLTAPQTGLPGVVSGQTANMPSVTISATGLTTITVYWKTPGDDSSASAHNLTLVTQIR